LYRLRASRPGSGDIVGQVDPEGIVAQLLTGDGADGGRNIEGRHAQPRGRDHDLVQIRGVGFVGLGGRSDWQQGNDQCETSVKAFHRLDSYAHAKRRSLELQPHARIQNFMKLIR
jgi:hypothetical protein